MTPTLAEFLLARLAEDEKRAEAARELNGGHWWTKDVEPWGLAIEGSTSEGNPRSYPGDPELWDHEGAIGMHPATANHVIAWEPDRVIAECEAKRRIVAERNDDNPPWVVLKHLALPYANHPDYRPEWRP